MPNKKSWLGRGGIRKYDPLPSLRSTVDPNQMVHCCVVKNVMGGCEIIDCGKSPITLDERIIVDYGAIGIDPNRFRTTTAEENLAIISKSPESLATVYQLEKPSEISRADLTICAVSDSEKSETTKLLNSSGSSITNTSTASTEYASMIEEVLNNVLESANSIKDEEDNDSNDQGASSHYQLVDYPTNHVVEITGNNSYAPVVISLQNYYEPNHVQSMEISLPDPLSSVAASTSSDSSLSSSCTAEGAVLPVVSADRHNQYYDLDSYKYHEKESEGSMETEKSQFNNLPSFGGLQTFFALDGFQQRVGTDGNIPTMTVVDEETIQTIQTIQAIQTNRVQPAKTKRKRDPSAKWAQEKTVCCTLCTKKFRTPGHLKTHFAVHSMKDGASMIGCDICGKNFCHRGALALHKRAHLPKIPKDKFFLKT